MTKREIERELNRIVDEMKSWRAINAKLKFIPIREVCRREVVSIGREAIVHLQRAKDVGDKKAESFHAEVYRHVKVALDWT